MHAFAPSQSPTVVLLGTLGQIPYAGIVWQVLHYLEGFKRLGCRVFYVEDSGAWPFDPEQNRVTEDCSFTVRFIARHMAWCGMEERWAYRAASQAGRIYGLSESAFEALFEKADLLVNLTGATVLREEHLRVPRRVYLETDPVLPQIEVAQGKQSTLDYLEAHTDHFTFGENLGAPDCKVPTGPFRYRFTRQPVVLDWWEPETMSFSRRREAPLTTIANWQQGGKDVVWNGETYSWSKHSEFLKFIALPRKAPNLFELALKCEDPETVQMLEAHGWRIADALAVSSDFLIYRDYIRRSFGEFTVAKDQNIRLRSGWFSDRAACYLASGLPVLNQDTAFGNILPTGCGLFSFRTEADVLGALEAINGDYARHSQTALEIAREYFAAEKTLRALLDALGFHTD